jgi:uridine kinase
LIFNKIIGVEKDIEMFISLTLEIRKWQNIPRKYNESYKKRHQIFKKLKNQHKLHLLEPLLEHADVDVQSRAASYYLLVDEDKAIMKLKEIMKMGGMKGFEIELLLNQWEKGELVIDHD